VTRMAALIEAAATALLPFLDRPFAFFGHSMGALVAFELASYLTVAYGRQAEHLVVAGARAPHLPDRFGPLHTLPAAALREELRRYGGTPQVVLDSPELLQLLLPALRADFAVCDTYAYTPRPALACPITAFGGRDDGRVACAELGAWRGHTNSAFEKWLLPGGHFFLHSARSVLLGMLSERLTSAAG
jgi:medium-chain acyl-[acyl-carrier-protein] hydrolase